jgi:hypothetical protein
MTRPEAAGGEPHRRTAERQAAERRKRREQVFGDALPDGTSDDREDGQGADRGSEDWLRRQVPPHHG